jgi:hypothetical protein
MTPVLDTLPITITKGEVFELGAGEHRRVAALVGNLWITQFGEPDDIVLRAGEATELANPGAALITSLGGDAVMRALWDMPMANVA